MLIMDLQDDCAAKMPCSPFSLVCSLHFWTNLNQVPI
uniref:Uncharacterized protein n=1 Tax=Anguilla anguilla TaxID=7936 RepID=A0A0E9PC58_ANGAN